MQLSLGFVIAALSISSAVAGPVLGARSGQVFTAPVVQNVASNSTIDITTNDRARIEFFKSPAIERRQKNAPVSNAVTSYVANIGVGSPATTYSLIVDTGSSNTWVGAGKKYVKTSTSKSTGHSIQVSYGSGSFSGTEYTDSVTLVSGLTVTNQGVGAASSSEGFDGVDGILGVGPEDLTSGTAGSGEIPTVVQTAYSEGLIPAQVLGVYFAPTTSENTVQNGELTYGGVDTSKTTGSISYNTVTRTSPAGEYWGLTASSSLASGSQSGIVDTGTTLIYLPSTWFSAYTRAIPSAVTDSSSGLVRFPKSSLSSVPDITFTVGSNKYTLNKYAQLVEQGLYGAFGLSSNYYYSWVGSSGSSGTGLDFILGQKFLERYYSVFDTDNNRIGFATTSNTSPTSAP